jgi:CDP-3, 6-dideoxy-D-glycero-L-glycero-4-hexulose-4-reductase
MKSFSLSSAGAVSLKQLVQLIEKLAGAQVNVRFGVRPYREREVMKPDIMDPVLPGWSCKISVENGLKELIHGAYLDRNLDSGMLGL